MSSLLKKVGTIASYGIGGPNAAKALFGGGSTSTYNAPNLDFLRQPAPTVNYDFLRNAASSAGGLAGQGATANYDFLRKASDTALDPTGGNYDLLRKTMGAPTSVDAVQDQVNNQALQDTLGNIERDTQQKFGSSIMDNYMRGLVGGGSNSDIAGNALAQVAAEGGRTASNAYTTLAGQNVARLQAKDAAVNNAYTADRSAGYNLLGQYAQGQGQNAQGYNSLLASGAGNQTSLLNDYASGLTGNADRSQARDLALAQGLTGSAASAAANTQRNPGLLKQMLTGMAGGFGQGLGSTLGK